MLLSSSSSGGGDGNISSSSKRIWLRVWPHAESALLYAGLVVIIICFISSFLSFTRATPTMTTHHICLKDVLCEDADVQVINSMYCGEHVEKEMMTCLCMCVCGSAKMQCKEKKKESLTGARKIRTMPCNRLNGVLLQRLHIKRVRAVLDFIDQNTHCKLRRHRIILASLENTTSSKGKTNTNRFLASIRCYGRWVGSCWRSVLAKIGSQVWQRVRCRVCASFISHFAYRHIEWMEMIRMQYACLHAWSVLVVRDMCDDSSLIVFNEHSKEMKTLLMYVSSK